MHRLGAIAIVVLAAALPAAAFEQDAYTIKIKSSIKGSATREHRSTSGVELSKFVDNDGKVVLENKRTTGFVSVYDQTILEQPAGKKRPTVLKRTYEKATYTEDDDVKELPYQGKTVLIEKKDGKYGFIYEGGAALTVSDARWLNMEFNKQADDDSFDFEAMVLPAKAIKPGESWVISPAEMIKQFEKSGDIKVDVDKSTGKGKLLKVFMQDGRQFGVWEYKIEIAFKEVPGVKLEPGASNVMEGTFTGCIDGSVVSHHMQSATKQTMAYRMPADNPQLTVTTILTATGEQSTSELTKK